MGSTLLLLLMTGAGVGAYVSGGEEGVETIPQHAHQEAPVEVVQPFELDGGIIERSTPMAAGGPIGVEVVRSYPFIWPANSGSITSYMGPNHPGGIDIGLAHDPVAPIFATAGGVVTFAGGGNDYDFGLYVTIDHGNGVSSLYAHLSRISVSQGQTVAQGAQVGLGGSTGKSDGKHLHFEIVGNGHAFDPLKLLPAVRRGEERLTADCGTSAIVLNQGSAGRFDFSRVLAGLSLTEVKLTSASASAPALPAVLENSSTVLVTTPVVVSGNRAEERYSLSVTAGPRAFDCEVIVRPLNVSPSYYERSLQASVLVKTPTPRPARTPTPVPDDDGEVLVTIDDIPVETITETPTESPTPTETPTETATPTVTATVTATMAPATATPPPPTATSPPPTATIPPPTATWTPTVRPQTVEPSPTPRP